MLVRFYDDYFPHLTFLFCFYIFFGFSRLLLASQNWNLLRRSLESDTKRTWRLLGTHSTTNALSTSNFKWTARVSLHFRFADCGSARWLIKARFWFFARFVIRILECFVVVRRHFRPFVHAATSRNRAFVFVYFAIRQNRRAQKKRHLNHPWMPSGERHVLFLSFGIRLSFEELSRSSFGSVRTRFWLQRSEKSNRIQFYVVVGKLSSWATHKSTYMLQSRILEPAWRTRTESNLHHWQTGELMRKPVRRELRPIYDRSWAIACDNMNSISEQRRRRGLANTRQRVAAARRLTHQVQWVTFKLDEKPFKIQSRASSVNVFRSDLIAKCVDGSEWAGQ